MRLSEPFATPGRPLERSGNRFPREMIATLATENRTRLIVPHFFLISLNHLPFDDTVRVWARVMGFQHYAEPDVQSTNVQTSGSPVGLFKFGDLIIIRVVS